MFPLGVNSYLSDSFSEVSNTNLTELSPLIFFNSPDSLFITGSQKYPVLDNLPFTVDWPENTTGGTTLYVVTVADENLDSVHTFSMTVDPPNARSMFSLDSQSKFAPPLIHVTLSI